jgi:GAF domain-containing protein
MMIMSTDYKLMAAQLKSLMEDEKNYMPVLSNASAILNDTLEDINWAGFYIVDNGSLLLGPFQGHVACIRIQSGKGVCGTAYATDTTQLVEDVHQFPGHIACDSASNSEIVVPIHKDGKVVAVMDIDSPSLSRFTKEDKEGLEAFAKVIEEASFTNVE